MPDKVFLDTNILIYAYDVSARKKHEVAKGLLIQLWESGLGVISTQVLQEFFVVSTRKIPNPMDIQRAEDIVSDLLKWEFVICDGDSILKAITLHRRYHFSFWDALIIAAALKANAAFLYSEDLTHGHSVEGLEIKNPFHPA